MNNKAFTISLMMAMAAALMIWSYIDSREKEWAKRYGSESVVVIAKKDIRELAAMTEDMIEMQNVPTNYQEPGTVSDKKDVLGMVALVPMRKGEQITLNKISPMGLRTGLSRQVTPGRRAVSIPVSEVTGVSKLLKPGDRVDLIAVMEPPNSTGRGNQVARTVMQDVSILAVGKFVTYSNPRRVETDDSGKQVVRNLHENDAYSTITVEVDPPGAQLLSYLSGASGVVMTVSLRNNDDTERVVLPGTTAADAMGAEAGRNVPRAPASTK